MRLVFVIVMSILAFSPAYINANPSDEDNSIVEYRKDGLGIMYLLTGSGQFFEDWARPETPLITRVNSVNRGDSIYPVILFVTDAADENGNASLTYDITILKPDGSVYGEFSDLVIWRDEPIDGTLLQRLAQPIAIRIEDTDPFGTYAVNVVVHEKNKKVSVPLSLSFDVQEARIINSSLDTLTCIVSQVDLSLFMDEYYTSPRPDLITEALLFVSDSGFLKDETVMMPAFGFFIQLFSQIDEAPELLESIGEDRSRLKSFVNLAMKLSKNPKEAFRRERLSPRLNDIYWGAFFASGDIGFIREITRHLVYQDNPEDKDLYLTGATAAWSLMSNATARPRVEIGLRLIQETSEPETAGRIESLMKKTPEEIMQEMTDVTKEQMENGAWK